MSVIGTFVVVVSWVYVLGLGPPWIRLNALPEQFLWCVRKHCPAGWVTAMVECLCYEGVYFVHKGVWMGNLCQEAPT